MDLDRIPWGEHVRHHIGSLIHQGGAPIFIHRPRTGSGRWSWYGLVSLPLMVRGGVAARNPGRALTADRGSAQHC